VAEVLGPPRMVSTDNSPTTAEHGPAWIHKAAVTNVNLRNWTVDVLTEQDNEYHTELQVASPYFHTENGEGIYAMPEVGSICLLAKLSDEATPFILAFLGSFELEGAQLDNLTDRAGEAANAEEETGTTPTTSMSTGAGQTTNSASARGGRPFLNPGDIMLRTRDKNFIVLKRGGVIQIGSTPTCQTVYVPILNCLRQFCENYEMITPGGLTTWAVQRQQNDPAGLAPILYRMTIRDKAQNDKADVQIKVGHISDTVRYEMEIAPQGIQVNDGAVTGSKLKMTIDVNGNQTFTMEGSLSYTIQGGRSYTVQGTDTLSVTGARSVEANSIQERSRTTHTLNALSSLEDITGTKTIKAAMVMLGKAPSEPAVLGVKLLTWLASHTHPAPRAPSEQAPQLATILSSKVVLTP